MTENQLVTLPIIAIDGTAASGKGTLARSLARKLGFAHMDTGALYRMVALRMIQNGRPAEDEQAAVEFAQVMRRTFNPRQSVDPALMTDEVSKMTSKTSAFPAVRAEVLEVQREFGRNPPDLLDGRTARGAILDGRDIGTVVFPDAPLKFFVTAQPETRAFRRFKELQKNGFMGTYDTVLAEMRERDERDASRATAPMKPAADAVILDTTSMSASQVLDKAASLIREKLGVLAE